MSHVDQASRQSQEGDESLADYKATYCQETDLIAARVNTVAKPKLVIDACVGDGGPHGSSASLARPPGAEPDSHEVPIASALSACDHRAGCRAIIRTTGPDAGDDLAGQGRWGKDRRETRKRRAFIPGPMSPTPPG